MTRKDVYSRILKDEEYSLMEEIENQELEKHLDGKDNKLDEISDMIGEWLDKKYGLSLL